jgi:MoaA/NifB/PqqE/SkfB family radical SAM enzyme
MEIPMVRVAVSIDGLREDHDDRRAPAIYDRILKNIEGCRVDISWVVTHPQMRRSSYLDEYLSFWSSRPEIDRIWLSTYTPQIGEKGEEMLTREDRQELILRLPELKLKYPALVLIEGMEQAINAPPPNHEECMFSKTNAVASA